MQRYSISTYLDTRRRKDDGKYPVKLRVYCANTKKRKLLSTKFNLSKTEFESILGTSKPRKHEYKEIRRKIKAIEQKANSIAEKLEVFTFEEFENKLYNKIGDSTKLVYHYENIINELKEYKQIKTAGNYNSSQKSFQQFCAKKQKKKYENLTFYDITPKWLNDYEFYMLDTLGRSPTTVSMYLRTLRTLFNNAIENKEISQKYYPFKKKKYQIPSSKKVKKALTQVQLKKLHETEPKSFYQQKAKDFWFFSFACNGLNVKDISLLQFKNIDDDKIVLYRAKTKRTTKSNLKQIVIYLNDFSKSIIEKYGNDNDKPDNYIFNIISHSDTAEKQRKKIQNFTRFINQHMKRLCKANDLPENISTNWARHSFATNSIRKGASMEFVGESLGHRNIETTKNYFAGFDSETKKKFSETIMDFD